MFEQCRHVELHDSYYCMEVYVHDVFCLNSSRSLSDGDQSETHLAHEATCADTFQSFQLAQPAPTHCDAKLLLLWLSQCFRLSSVKFDMQG